MARFVLFGIIGGGIIFSLLALVFFDEVESSEVSQNITDDVQEKFQDYYDEKLGEYSKELGLDSGSTDTFDPCSISNSFKDIAPGMSQCGGSDEIDE